LKSRTSIDKNHLLVFGFFAFFSIVARAIPLPSLTGSIGNHNSYFLEDNKFRHLRGELQLNHKTTFSDRLLSVISGRARADLALSDLSFSPYRNLPSETKKNEFLEGELRQMYLDYMHDLFRLKAGLQNFDWIESLSPFSSELITPIDFRHGAFGTYEQNLVPVPALSSNHPLMLGTLDWILIPVPRTSRFALSENGYGTVETLQSLVAPLSLRLVDQGIERKPEEIEFGARYLLRMSSWEASLFGFRGHQRVPVMTASLSSPTEMTITRSYPRLNTFGGFLSYADEAWILKFHLFLQPDRGPDFVSTGMPMEKAAFWRGGIGFDYVFSRHLKFYSELWYSTRSSHSDFLGTGRITNETWKDLLLSFTFTASSPESSTLISPEVEWKAKNDLKLSCGAKIVTSNSTQSLLHSLRNADQIFGTLTYFFNLR
jgi:hypothetical protein